jgi:NodT family efflux transporter outer membrane factor (OMF) lipoprotein
MRPRFCRLIAPLLVAAILLPSSGCTGPIEYVRNGFKVGPNYHKPPAPVAQHWIDAADARIRNESDPACAWWEVFNDPILNRLMVNAYQQNLTLRQAGSRVLSARAQLAITHGEFFPQSQNANGSYQRRASGGDFTDQWSLGFNLSWEVDVWGRFRRAIASQQDLLDASVEDYDAVLVTLLADAATAYLQIRTDQERIRLLQENVRVQQDVLTFVEERLKVGFHGVTDLDRAQADGNLKQTMAAVHLLQIDMRQAANRLCVLLGIPPEDILAQLDPGPIPVAPPQVAVGMPADLLRRRPDVRRAERLAAAQAEQIGIAEADLYPAFSIDGSLGWSAAKLSNLFDSSNFRGNVGPSFQWNLLNYGRIINNVRLQDSRFQELVYNYQQLVLQADEEVENGIVNFLESQERAQLLLESVDSAQIARRVALAQYQQGIAGADFNRYATIEQSLIGQQDAWAQSRGSISLGLINIYRGLGGGWQIRLQPQGQSPEAIAKPPAEALPPQNGAAPPAPNMGPRQGPLPFPAPPVPAGPALQPARS